MIPCIKRKIHAFFALVIDQWWTSKFKFFFLASKQIYIIFKFIYFLIRYIEQFTEILTEKRRKPHRIIRNLSDESTFTDDNINVNISSETDTYSNEQYNIPKKPKIVQNLSLNGIRVFLVF